MAETQAEQARQAAFRQQSALNRVEPVPRMGFNPGQFPGQTVSPTQPSTFSAQNAPSVTTAWPANTSAQFQTMLASVRDNVNRLIPELQRSAQTNPTAREVIGDVYQVAAETESLFGRARNGEAAQSLLIAYQPLDVRWRDVSYRLRSAGAVDSRMASLVAAIDESFQSSDRQLGITPPIDRVRLRDLMIVTLTYMDAMFDDVRLAPAAFGQADAILREGRILRERLRQESYKIDRADYNQILASYTEFVRQWRGFGLKLYQLNDAHINLRLDSIRRQGDEVYASLRIPAASDRSQIKFAAQRLSGSLVALQLELNRRGANRLPPDQFQFAGTINLLVDRSQRLELEITSSGASRTAASQFSEMDNLWTTGLRAMRAIDPRSGLKLALVQVDTIFNEVRDVLRVEPSQGNSQAVSVAASLEVVTDDFNIDVQRYKRYLNPVDYRDSLSRLSENLANTALELHRSTDQGGNSADAKRLAQQMVSQWQQLTPVLGEVTQRGLSQSRATTLFDGYQQMQPLIAQAASMLLN